ncbi:MAG: hypothetical protein O2887_10025 [Bacteroidetes bacterium]|nr:hypothetical protein [Bacteroidota bacterium]MDA1120806.1 hypothetical protein [Bacteroidota bacterium]
MKTLSALVVIMILTVSCVQFSEMVGTTPADINAIKSITTTFICYQDDTREKDNRIIAVATFYPDGTIENLTQHMTYPYNYSDPLKKELWDEPIKSNLTHVMDGLELGHAEKNLLYGNDWPVKYANVIKEKGHPSYEMFNDFHIEYVINDIPSKIVVNWPEGGSETSYMEEFRYENDRLTLFSSQIMFDEEAIFGHLIPKDLTEEKREEFINDLKSKNYDFFGLKDTKFKYRDNSLIEVDEGRRLYKFDYDENNHLSRSELYVIGNLTNYRIYYYI